MGGTSGISIIAATLLPHMDVGTFMFIINGVLIVLGLVFLGARGHRGHALLFGGALVLCLGAGARRAHGPPVYGRHVPGAVLRRYPACGGQRYYF